MNVENVVNVVKGRRMYFIIIHMVKLKFNINAHSLNYVLPYLTSSCSRACVTSVRCPPLERVNSGPSVLPTYPWTTRPRLFF